MTGSTLEHMHMDIEMLKRDISVIKHILSEEGELTIEAKRRLATARRAADSQYVELE